MTNRLKVLIFNSVGNTGAASMLDHIGIFKKYSQHEYFYHNFIYDFDVNIDLNPFDVIVITHNFWPEALSAARRAKIRESTALKVMFLQDEYQCIREINNYMDEMGIQVMFSCVDEKDFNVFYPKSIISSLLHVEPVLTGYVPEYLTQSDMRARGLKEYDVGYRSRISPYYLGKLGHQKKVIADRFKVLCPRHGLRYNISVEEEDRLYGKQWLKFLRSCRTQIGTPSGSSIIDFDNTIIMAETAYRQANPHSGFEDVHEAILSRHERKLVIDTVSPRIFEATATGSTLVLLAGHYGGILQAGDHYIPIEKDYSNLDDVAEMIKDDALCEKIADRAYADLIASGAYSAAKFAEQFDKVLERFAKRDQKRPAADQIAFGAMLRKQHQQCLFFGPDGYGYDDSEIGKKFKRHERIAGLLTKTPFIGPLFARVGGDPIVKTQKAFAAIRIANYNKPLRSLIFAWMLDSELRRKVEIDSLLKDILLLSVVMAGQAGATYPGVAFRTRIKIVGTDLILYAYKKLDAGIDEEKVSAKGLAAGRALKLDMSNPFPIQRFASTTILTWPFAGNYRTLRSSADEYFHFRGLTAIARKRPDIVEYAIDCALSPVLPKRKKQLEKAFGVPF